MIEGLDSHWITGIGALLALFTLIFLPYLIKTLVWKVFSMDKRVQKVLSERKSSEVRLGNISETIAPLLYDFPVDIEKAGTSTVFLGKPVDYIHFDPDEGITFIEVKSGGAKLSKVQREMRQAIEEGRVYWEEYRVTARKKAG